MSEHLPRRYTTAVCCASLSQPYFYRSNKIMVLMSSGQPQEYASNVDILIMYYEQVEIIAQMAAMVIYKKRFWHWC